MVAKRLLLVGLLLIAACAAHAQRSKDSSQSQTNFDVEVTRSAILRATIASDPATVFEYLVDASKLQTWFPDQAVSEAQLGGRYHFRWDDTDGVWSGRYTNFIRGNTLAYTWQAPGDDYETSVQIRLTPQAGGTLIELTHSGFVTDAALDKVVKSWVFYLGNLRSVIEDGVDLRPKMRQKSHPRSSHATKRGR